MKKIDNNHVTEAYRIIDDFNKTQLKNEGIVYIPRVKGLYLYLGRDDDTLGGPGPIFRLKYTGDMEKWEFEIYKYTSDMYDPEEFLFPGAGCVDGTVRGALKAGMKAYPVF